jgi:toxin-antitoxin system PIN domain toxin
VKIVDANVLIYSVDQDARHHFSAKAWMSSALAGGETVVLPWLCLLAFVRITTHPRIFDRPLSIDQALDAVEAWLGAPPVCTAPPTQPLLATWRGLLGRVGVGGNLVNDAYLAALAVAADAELVSFDSDFSRFPGLKWVLPADIS